MVDCVCLNSFSIKTKQSFALSYEDLVKCVFTSFCLCLHKYDQVELILLWKVEKSLKRKRKTEIR